MKHIGLIRLFKEFQTSEKTSGFILVACAVISLLLANSPSGTSYNALWQSEVAGHSFEFWINDALMAVFFLLVGLEIKRELYVGRLADMKSALLPVFAALGGILIPAGIHFMLNACTSTQAGAGIPMATDIAFALGVLSLLGNRIPLSVKIFLTALAIIDDLGAIAVLAICYTSSISIHYFIFVIALFSLLILCNKAGIKTLWLYLPLGVLLWFFTLQSGIHATISGVLLAFAIPFGNGSKEGAAYKLQHFLHRPVAYLILPLFALANTSVSFNKGWSEGLLTSNSLGITLGLIIGKPLGIVGFSYLVVKARWGALANDMQWKHIIGIGILGGIGFTMSIFIARLAFSNSEIIIQSKIAVFMGTAIATISGLIYLKISTSNK